MRSRRRTAVASFEEVYDEHLEPVWRYVRSRVRSHDEAQDATAEVFERALASWGRYDPARGTVGAWLFRIAHNTVADHHRRTLRDGRRREEPVPEVPPTTSAMPPEDTLVQEELLGQLREAMTTLSERDRDVLALRFGAGLRARDVAEVLGISESAAKMAVHRAVGRLRQVISS